MIFTPVEDHDGLLLKREDALRAPNGVSGKLRAARYLIGRAVDAGGTHAVYGGSVQSPAVARVATMAGLLQVPVTIVIGATTAAKALPKHAPVRLAAEAGAEFREIKVAYNPALQKEADRLATQPGWFKIGYGVTTEPDATPDEVRSFLDVDARQVINLTAPTLVLALGSGNTAAAVLHGLLTRETPVEQVHLLSVGPDRWQWVLDRLAYIGHPPIEEWPFEVHVHRLFPDFAKWGDLMPGQIDDVALHPAYEGKMLRWLDLNRPAWWTPRDGTVCWWIVGGVIR